MLNEKQLNKLPTMVKTWLLVNPQSESATQNVLRLLNLLADDKKEEVYNIIKEDLIMRLNQQKLAIQEQIDLME